MKFITTGLSLLELREKYGVGEKGFYDNSWWLNEPFSKKKPEAGEWEIDMEKNLTNLPYEEQKKKLKKGFDFPHPAVLAEAILSHYAKTKERFLEDWYSRTNILDSDGDRVIVGRFDSDGLVVDNYWDDRRLDYVGVSSSKKLKSKKGITSETLPDSLEINGVMYRKL